MADNANLDDVDQLPLRPDQRERTLDRLRVRCFRPGTRVQVRPDSEYNRSLAGLKGKVVSASDFAAYVALDKYVEDGDPDPFRIDADDLIWIPESADLDAPEPYLAGLDYVEPLLSLGYKVGSSGMHKLYRKSIPNNNWTESPHQGASLIRIDVVPLRDTPLVASIFVDYLSIGELERIQRIIVPYIEIIDIVREIEQLTIDPDVKGVSDFAKKLEAKHYPGEPVTQTDRLYYMFGESCLQESADMDDPQPYIDRLKRHADVIDAFKDGRAVKLMRKLSPTRPHYTLLWMPNVELSYDIFLTPHEDGSWKVGAEAVVSYTDEDGGDYIESFPLDRTWTFTPDPELLYGQADEIMDAIRAEALPKPMPAAETDTEDPDDTPPAEVEQPVEESAHPEDDDVDPTQFTQDVLDVRPILLKLGFVCEREEDEDHWECWEKAIKAEDDTYTITVALKGVKMDVFVEACMYVKSWDYLTDPDQEYWLERFREQFSDEENESIGPKEALRGARNMYQLEGKPIKKTESLVQFNTDDVPAKDLAGVLERLESKVIEFAEDKLSESVNDDDVLPKDYLATTFSATDLLDAYGWQRLENKAGTERGIFIKTYPLPTYQLGGITIDRLEIKIDTDLRSDTDEYVVASVKNAEGNGLPIANWRLERRLAMDDERAEYGASDGTTSTLRRFVSGLDAVIKNIKLPSSKATCLMAGNVIQSALNRFIYDLNAGARHASLEESDDLDAPDNYVRELGTVSHVLKLNGFKECDWSAYNGFRDWACEVKFTSPARFADAAEAYDYLQVKVNYNVKPYRNPQGKRHQIFITVYSPNRWHSIIWSAEGVFATEAEAARALNEALQGVIELIKNINEPYPEKELRKRLQHGPGAIFRSYYQEAVEDGDAEVVNAINNLPPYNERTLAVRPEVAALLQRTLSQPGFSGRLVAAIGDDTFFSADVRFGDGRIMNICVYDSSYEEDPAWCRAALYADESLDDPLITGDEREQFLGDYELVCAGTRVKIAAGKTEVKGSGRYIVHVVEDPNAPDYPLLTHADLEGLIESVDDVTDADIKSHVDMLPPRNHKQLKVTKETAEDMQAILTDPYASSDQMADDVAFDRAVTFDDGKFMVIQVIYGQYREEDPEDSCTGYAQGVLFDGDGHKVDCTPAFDQFTGLYTLDDTEQYTVEVVVDKPVAESEEPVDDVEIKRQIDALPAKVAYVNFYVMDDATSDIECAAQMFPEMAAEEALPEFLVHELIDSQQIRHGDVELAENGFKWESAIGGAYHIRLRFTGWTPDAELRDRIQAAYDLRGISGTFWIEDFQSDSGIGTGRATDRPYEDDPEY